MSWANDNLCASQVGHWKNSYQMSANVYSLCECVSVTIPFILQVDYSERRLCFKICISGGF